MRRREDVSVSDEGPSALVHPGQVGRLVEPDGGHPGPGWREVAQLIDVPGGQKAPWSILWNYSRTNYIGLLDCEFGLLIHL